MDVSITQAMGVALAFVLIVLAGAVVALFIRNRSNREPEVVQAEENQITGWVDHDCGLNCFHPAHNYDDMSKYTIVTDDDVCYSHTTYPGDGRTHTHYVAVPRPFPGTQETE